MSNQEIIEFSKGVFDTPQQIEEILKLFKPEHQTQDLLNRIYTFSRSTGTNAIVIAGDVSNIMK